MARLDLLEAIRLARSIQRLPDGSPIPSSLSHALLVLATYWPNIWPSQHRLASDMSVSRRAVNKRLAALEASGLIIRHRRGKRSTAYQIDFRKVRLCELGDPPVVSSGSQEEQ